MTSPILDYIKSFISQEYEYIDSLEYLDIFKPYLRAYTVVTSIEFIEIPGGLPPYTFNVLFSLMSRMNGLSNNQTIWTENKLPTIFYISDPSPTILQDFPWILDFLYLLGPEQLLSLFDNDPTEQSALCERYCGLPPVIDDKKDPDTVALWLCDQARKVVDYTLRRAIEPYVPPQYIKVPDKDYRVPVNLIYDWQGPIYSRHTGINSAWPKLANHTPLKNEEKLDWMPYDFTLPKPWIAYDMDKQCLITRLNPAISGKTLAGVTKLDIIAPLDPTLRIYSETLI